MGYSADVHILRLWRIEGTRSRARGHELRYVPLKGLYVMRQRGARVFTDLND
jgi:hypothetical protein